MKLSDILLLLKGKRAAVGEIRNWKGGSYIKTPTGWKPHEKQYSKKYTERKNNAATKKDTDLRNRQSEVARLSGEIQGHKAAVEHHTSQNTKQDTRQAKHHSIRAQVKQRRLDKHKEILEQRHGVKDEVVKPVKKKQFNFSKPLSLNSIQNNTWGKQPENLSNDDLLKTYAYVKYANYAIRRNLINAPTGKTHILPQVGGQDNINAFENEIKKRGLENAFEIDIDLSQYRVKSQEAKANFEKWKADRQEEKPKKDEPVDFEKEHQKIQEAYAKDNARYNDIIKRIIQKSPKEHEKKFLAEAYDFVPDMNHIDRDYLLDIAKKYGVNTEVKETPSKRAQVKQRRLDKHKEILEKRHGVKDEPVVEKKWSDNPEIKDYVNKLEPEQKDVILKERPDLKANFESWKADRQAKSDTPKEKPESTKSDVIQSGSRGATIAGQQYSKREVDILNSLDEIIGRAKSPVVQDLLKKRQAAKPTPKTSNLEPHESKFMELVGKNRSQADKQAGYPEERRKVEAETGVKIPREKVNDILSGKSSQVSTPKSDDKGR
jgi:hypothetical protein